MGLSLTESDFRNIFIHPRAVITGLCCQMILLPVLAFFIARISHMDPLFKVGLMIIAACPGGATSNLITYLLRGNVALSISMTAMNSIITLITIPLVVTLSLGFFIHQDADIHLNVGGNHHQCISDYPSASLCRHTDQEVETFAGRRAGTTPEDHSSHLAGTDVPGGGIY